MMPELRNPRARDDARLLRVKFPGVNVKQDVIHGRQAGRQFGNIGQDKMLGQVYPVYRDLQLLRKDDVQHPE